MPKKFKSRKHKNKIFVFKTIFFIGFIIILYVFISSFLLKLKLTTTNEQFLKDLLKDSNHHLAYEKNEHNFLGKMVEVMYQVDIQNPLTILKNFFNYEESPVGNIVTSSDNNIEPIHSTYIEDPSPKEEKEPLVYVYNTHQTENYSYKKYEEYNITPNVMMASYILREKLNNKGIPTIVETTNISDLLHTNGWSYANSYKASSFLVKDAIKKYPTLKLVIDLHRDAVKKEASTVEINQKKYAKILFVIGAEHDAYEKNLRVANKMNDLLNKKYKGLSRGVMKKSGKNVNGIYNQDLSENAILIECGGHENTLDEVLNTIEILADVIKEYIGD
jgi:stage II sporulation protein P